MSLLEKLGRIQTEIKAPKNLYNSFGKYKYRNAESICEAVKPFLMRERCCLTLSDEIVEAGGRIYVKATATLTDTEDAGVNGQYSVTAYAREADDKKGMDAAQVTGATSSYARKYALNGMFLLDDTKDPDTDEYRQEKEERQNAARDQQKTEEVAAQAIDTVKIAALRRLFHDKAISEEKVRALYKVARLEDLTERQHANILGNIDQVAARCGV